MKNPEKLVNYEVERFDDFRILKFDIPGFEKLSLKEKELLYYLYEAALSGRDIIWDQNYKHNLFIRRTLEAIIDNFKGDRSTEDFTKFHNYLKQVWFSNGIHHFNSTEKIKPQFPIDYFKELILNSYDFLKIKQKNTLKFPLRKSQNIGALLKKIIPLIFDMEKDLKRVNLDLTNDLIKCSANNYYEGVSQKEAEEYYNSKGNKNNAESFGLNSKLVKEGGKIFEKTWKVDGMYSKAIEKIVYWLNKALEVTENKEQYESLKKLIEFYKTGDLKTFDEYSILWVKDISSKIDVVNGFIEVYGDPLGKKGSFESVVSIRDEEATKRSLIISENAQWFEDNAPIDDEYKKQNVKGITAKVINVVVESGDCSPVTPIGINLPNADWIREKHGSKSVSIGNIMHSFEQVSKNSGAIDEFAYSEEEIKLSKQYGELASILHTDLHEILGHGSGKLKQGVADPSETLKNYASTLEEARADLFALYYLYDKKLIELGLIPTIDVGKACYNSYIRGGLLVQLARIEKGKQIEESHMRNRQLIAKWAFEKGLNENVIEMIIKNGKTFFVVNDYNKLRNLFGQLLKEIQRIKSEGDFETGKFLVENYGVNIDSKIHEEVLNRWADLKLPKYSGFINPILVPIFNENKIIEIKIEYHSNFTDQMKYYAKNYSILETYN